MFYIIYALLYSSVENGATILQAIRSAKYELIILYSNIEVVLLIIFFSREYLICVSLMAIFLILNTILPGQYCYVILLSFINAIFSDNNNITVTWRIGGWKNKP